MLEELFGGIGIDEQMLSVKYFKEIMGDNRT